MVQFDQFSLRSLDGIGCYYYCKLRTNLHEFTIKKPLNCKNPARLYIHKELYRQ